MNKNLIIQYFDIQEKFEKKYGKNTLVFMQVGSFFEMYGVDNEVEKIGDLNKITSILNISLTRRDKKILENSRENALMAGVPLYTRNKYINILLQNNYTVVLIEQVSKKPKIVRKVTEIFSPGTYIDEISKADSNNIVSIYLNKSICYRTGQEIWLIGMSSIDLSTGNNLIYETNIFGNNIQNVIEDIYRFLEANNPSEIILNYKNIEFNEIQKIKNNINLINRLLHLNIKIDNKFTKVSYQNQFLSKLFPDHGLLTPIEFIDLERKPIALLSYMIILQFSYEHNENIIKNINKPEIWNCNEHLILYNDTVYQLNVLPNNNSLKCSNKIKSLFDVVNKTKTTMGKRLLKNRLTNPITSISKLEKRYDLIDIFIKNSKNENVVKIEKYLKDIIDIERFHRKIVLNKLNPCDFYRLYYNYLNINKLFNSCSIIFDNNINKYFNITNKDISLFKSYQEECSDIFYIDEMGKYNLDGILQSFIKTGKDEKIDEITMVLVKSKNYLENEASRLSNLIDKNKVPQPVKLLYNERDGYYFSLTKNRYKILKNKLEINEYREYKHTNTAVKLVNDKLNKFSDKVVSSTEKIKSLVKDFYLKTIYNFYSKYSIVLKNITNFVAEIDVVQSNYNCAIDYAYVRPSISINQQKANKSENSNNSNNSQKSIKPKKYDNVNNSKKINNSNNKKNNIEIENNKDDDIIIDTDVNINIIDDIKDLDLNSSFFKEKYDEIINKVLVKKENNNNKFEDYSNKNDKKKKINEKIDNIVEQKYNKKMNNINKEVKVVEEINNNNCKYDKDKSYFKSSDLRHPIIERLQFSAEYVANDIEIGNNVLLYGVNGSGKSSLSKAIGLNIIMAQSGMYVPCSSFTYYPYNKIFTRINSDDNIFKGQSSFVVEMTELRSILKNADKNSIVLGDEICKGTEEISALSIVYASIKKLLEKQTSFILATHFHKLYKLCKEDNNIFNKLSFKHLTIEYLNNNIKYIRKLKEGTGDNIYGIEIANFIIDDKSFIKSANLIRNKLLKKNKNILESKSSNYNKDLYVHKCSVCDINVNQEELHTHHIKEQHNFNENNLLGHIKKNNINNLVILCSKHHHDVHHGNLIINGYLDTTKGKILDYKIVKSKKKSNKKYNKKQIDIINQFSNSSISISNIIIKLKNNYDIKISRTTLNKILKGTY